MLEFFRRSRTKRDAHAANGCGCGSRHAHSETSDLAAPAGEGCCSNQVAEAKDRQPLAAEPGPASLPAHRGCCGGHAVTVQGDHRTTSEHGR